MWSEDWSRLNERENPWLEPNKYGGKGECVYLKREKSTNLLE